MSKQVLSSGQTLSEKYGGGLGGFVGRMKLPPSRIRALFVGLPGEGKSCFIQSNPDAFIFNLDGSSTTTPNPHAAIWPGIDPDGNVLLEPGKKGTLTWDEVEKRIFILKRLAEKDEPRPTTIVFDSLTSMISLLMEYIPRKAPDLALAGSEKKSWNELDGRAAWDWLHRRVISVINELKNAGYGVIVIGHVVNSKTPIGEDRYAFVPELTITDNFWKKLYNIFDLVACVYAENETVEKEREQVTTLPSGQVLRKMRKYTEKVKVHKLTVTKDYLEGVLKDRVGLTEFVLPHEDGWTTFENAYLEAAQSQEKPNG